jgi:hypothetical protein
MECVWSVWRVWRLWTVVQCSVVEEGKTVGKKGEGRGRRENTSARSWMYKLVGGCGVCAWVMFGLMPCRGLLCGLLYGAITSIRITGLTATYCGDAHLCKQVKHHWHNKSDTLYPSVYPSVYPNLYP